MNNDAKRILNQYFKTEYTVYLKVPESLKKIMLYIKTTLETCNKLKEITTP